ncbi:hypothetical protein ABZ027_12595 [Streptomyces sp. NPDC006332]|uniref:hypothetical protein n=1 Tax=Streptomyces sp. NPDC006332 TaxID=3155456 RepID=UPI0033BE7B5A
MAASFLLATLGTLVGCSGSNEAQEYDVPKNLCGVSVDPQLISKLLPPGKTVEVRERNPVPSRKRCQINIDGKAALIASREWWEKEDSINDVADAHPQLESAQSGDNNTYLYSDTGGVERVNSCVNRDHAKHTLFTAIQAYGKSVNDADAVKKLMRAYTRAVENSDECQ